MTDHNLEDVLRRIQDLEQWRDRNKVEVPIFSRASYAPTYTGGATPGTTTYTVQVGEYVRIGSLVHAQGRVTWTNATGTGVARISLPLTAANIANAFGAVALVTDAVTFASGAPQGLILPNAAYFELKYPVSNAATVDIAIEAAGTVFFSATYIIA